MVYTHVLLYLHCSLISDSGRQRGRHSCSAAGKEQSLVVVQQMSCANRVESALLCSRLLLCMRILLFYKWFTILPHDVLPCDALTCLLPFGFALAISLLAFCLCIFCSFVWGQVFAISCLVAVSFTEFPSPFLCYAMLIRCRAMSPAGFDERAGLLFYLIFAGIVCFIGMFLFLQLDLFPGLQRRPQ